MVKNDLPKWSVSYVSLTFSAINKGNLAIKFSVFNFWLNYAISLEFE